MSVDLPAERTPIVCDMTGAPDTAEERMAEWGRVIEAAYLHRERAGASIALRFRADDGIDAWVRDLSAREKACCPFLDFTVTVERAEVRWEVTVADDTVIDDETLGPILDWLFDLPDTVGDGIAGMADHFDRHGITVSSNASGSVFELRSH